MKINKKVFELDSVLDTFNYSKVLEHYNSLLEIEKELQNEEIELLNVSEDIEQAMLVVDKIEEQLDYLYKNLSVFRDALVILEAQCFQRVKLEDITYKLCLN